MISFSKRVKEEIIHNSTINNEKEAQIYLSAIFHSLSTVIYENEEYMLEIKTTHIFLIRDIAQKFKIYYSNIPIQLIVRENKNFSNQKRTYIIKIKEKIEELLTSLNLIENKLNLFTKYKIPKYIETDDKTLQIYMKYFFVCNGSINDPKIQKQYHMEMINTQKYILQFIAKKMSKYDINFKITVRKNISALYLNKAEEIADFLKLIGVLDTLFEFEDYRLYRDIRVSENRLINAEIANEQKKQNNTDKHLKAIKKLSNTSVWDNLSEKTKQVAQLRKDNPDLSLAELSQITNGAISKSNIRHHLEKIYKLSQE